MSKTRHRQGVQQWNPPPLPKGNPLSPDEEMHVVSSTECTGLTPQPVRSESESESYADLYTSSDVKPQGNVGKCNPRNNPSEIAFHRTENQHP